MAKPAGRAKKRIDDIGRFARSFSFTPNITASCNVNATQFFSLQNRLQRNFSKRDITK